MDTQAAAAAAAAEPRRCLLRSDLPGCTAVCSRHGTPVPGLPRAAQVELCGRAMHIGRPKGYVPPAPGEKVPPAPPRNQQAAAEQKQAAVPGPAPTTVLLLSNLLPAGELRTEAERREVRREQGGTQT